MATFDGLFTKTAPSKTKSSKKDPFAGVFAKKPPVNPVAASHPFNPLNPNAKANLDKVTGNSTTNTFQNFKSSFGGAAKEVGNLAVGKKSLLVNNLLTDSIKNLIHPSEMTRQAEKAVPNVPVLKQTGQLVLRSIIPLAEGFGTLVGGDIFGQNELSKQTANAPIQTVGSQAISSVPENLVTHKLTAEDVVNVALNSIQVGLLIAPFISKAVSSGSVGLSDLISKKTKVPITFSDLQKITTSSSDLEAIQRVGVEKFNAYKEAAQSKAIRKAVKQGYVELAQRNPSKFANVLRNIATRPITEVANFTKPYGKPVVVPNVGLLPERITFQEAQTTAPEVLKHYEPILDKGVVDYQLKQLSTPEVSGQLSAPKEKYVSGQGFEMTDKVNPQKLAAQKESIAHATAYKAAIAKYNANPTPRNLAVVQKLRAAKIEADNLFLEKNAGKKINGITIPKEYKAYRRTITGDTVDIKRLKTNPEYFVKTYESTFARGHGTDEKLYKILTKELVPKGREASSYLSELYNKSKATQKVEVKATEPAKPVESKPAVQGQTPSKIARSIEQKAVEQGLTKGFEGVAGYDKITIKDQAERAVKQLSNLQETRQILRGEKPLPDGLRGSALITAVEEQIKKTGDGLLAFELANSPLVSETSAAAQELRLAAERTPDSVTAQLRQAKDAREAKLKPVKEKIKVQIKREKAKAAPKAKDWSAFLDEIKCK